MKTNIWWAAMAACTVVACAQTDLPEGTFDDEEGLGGSDASGTGGMAPTGSGGSDTTSSSTSGVGGSTTSSSSSSGVGGSTTSSSSSSGVGGSTTSSSGVGGGTTSSSSGVGGSTTSSSSGSGGGGTCDMQGSCEQCANCSLNSTCLTQANACFNDPDCNAFLNCLSACMGQVCADQCVTNHPAGAQLYFQLVDCALCTACPNDCAVEGQGFCGP